MKDFNSMSDKEIVLQKVWKLFDVLRRDINTEDYSVVLLFVYLRSKDLLSYKFDNSNRFRLRREFTSTIYNEIKEKYSLNNISTNFDFYLYEKKETLLQIINFYQHIIDTLDEHTFFELIHILLSLDTVCLNENIETIFDQTLERIAISQGKIGGEFIQPKQLTEFVNAYLGSTKGLKVFNPFAGVVSFIKDYKDSSFVYAQELRQKNWAIGQLRLIVYKIEADFKCEDSIANWPIHEKFDLIVANPPFGMRLNGAYRELYPYFRTAEEFLLNIGLDSLTSSGKLVAVLPQGILFRGGSEQRLRERLITEDFIDTIISFPGGILHHTGIPFIVLVLNKSKELPGKIRLVAADDCVSKPSPRENIIEVEKLLSVSQQVENSDAVRIITNDDVIANDFNLNIPRYFQDDIKGVKLKHLLTYFRGSRRDIPVSVKMIRIRDLSDDKLDFKLDVSNVEETEFTRPHLRIIDESCLLLATRWKTLKPTYFEFYNEPIFLNPDILSFKINEQIVDTAYLINELHADYVEEQLTSYRQGATIPMIRRDDLLEIVIKLPSIEEQRAKVAGLQEISEKIKQLQKERNELVHGFSTKEFNEFASLKHTLGRPRQNILGWSKNLSKFFIRERNSISALNDEFKSLFDLGIIEAIDEINRDIKFISDVLEKGENGLVLNDYEKDIVPLTEVNNIINTLSNNEFKFSIKKQLLKVDEMKTRGILINKVLFRTLLDNLLTNANKYGFLDMNKGNHVMIELSEIDDHLIIDVRNNGLPFPKNFDREKFITKYSTADTSNGSGLGGYDINRIATYFENENWDLILNTDPIYPVIFRFSFPIKLLK